MSFDLSSLLSWLEKADELLYEDWLNVRDTKKFDDRWTEARDGLEGPIVQIPNAEEMFSKLYDICNGHELVGYILDDLDMIHTYAKEGKTHPMIDHMIKSYEKGAFPIINDQEVEPGVNEYE